MIQKILYTWIGDRELLEAGKKYPDFMPLAIKHIENYGPWQNNLMEIPNGDVRRAIDKYTPDKIIISMAAGITIASIESYLNGAAKVVRIMPNAPARVGEMMASVSFNDNVSDDEKAMVIDLLSGMGKAIEVPEEMISQVIGVSGSSPAYTYMYIKALAASAEEYGMDEDKAKTFAAKIVLKECCKGDKEDGSALTDLDTLIDNVCTPGGTTIEAVKYLRENDFEELVKNGAKAAIEKSIAMSRQ